MKMKWVFDMTKVKNIILLFFLITIVIISGCVSQGASTTSGTSQTELVMGIGQAVTVGSFNISLTSMPSKESARIKITGEPEEKMILYVNIVNVEKSSTYLSNENFKLIDEQGRQFDSLNDKWISGQEYGKYIIDGSDTFSNKLQPSINYYTGLVFDIPNGQKFMLKFCNSGICKNIKLLNG